ncbi:MAG TPA: 4-hydroxy-3-methylbut-2-enyl diphosphate reductase [Victivallales bacterium]|nr:4-hydroxy-3-methylbut-2-enyl diphosphate reductase [Victivallales bacterium]
MHKQLDFLPLKKVSINKVKFNKNGRFKILLPEVFGFCGGVITALKKMESVLNECSRGQKIFLLGEIIHNSAINDYLFARKVNIIHEDNLEDVINIAGENDIIVIPAFGIAHDLEVKIREKYRFIIDTACRYVKLVWNFIERESEKGSTIIIYGQPGHQEVQAGISRASKTSCVLVIPNLAVLKKFSNIILNKFKNDSFVTHSIFDDIKEISLFNSAAFNINNLALASQTTMLYDEVIAGENILSDLSKKINSNFISCNTICKATYNRQNAAKNLLSKKPDVVFVIGGYDSSNTNHLFELANQKTRTFYIKDSSYISELHVKHYIPREEKEIITLTENIFLGVDSVAVLAGASCPFYIVKNVMDKLADI